MHRLGGHGGIFGVLLNTADGGGGGFAGSGAAVAEPTYQVPNGVGAGGEGQDGKTGTPTSGTTNPNSGGEPAAPASRDGAAAQTTDPNAPNKPAGQSNNLPAGRSEEQAGRRQSDEVQQLRQQLQEQGGIITRLKQVFAPESAKDPRLERIRNGIFEAMPELKALVGLNPEQISKALEAIPAFQRQHDTHWESLADRTMASVHQAVMPYVLGADGKLDQLTEDQKLELGLSFRSWCLRDTTGARVRRYEAGDPKIVEDFRDYYATTHHAPAHRANVAAAAARAAAGQNLPKAGKADATGTPVPKVDPQDEDAVHGAAWKHVSNALRGS